MFAHMLAHLRDLRTNTKALNFSPPWFTWYSLNKSEIKMFNNNKFVLLKEETLAYLCAAAYKYDGLLK